MMRLKPRPEPRSDAGPTRARLLLTFAGILLLLGLAAAALNQLSPGTAPAPYSLRSNATDGLLGLRLWLERMGYRVQTPQSIRPADLAGADADLILLYPPAIPVGRERASALAQWAAEGHTLAVIAAQDIDLETTFGIGLQAGSADGGVTVHQGQPLLADAAPPSHTMPPGQALAVTTFAGQAAVPVLLDESGAPTLTVQTQGEGVVWYLSPRHDLANNDLRSGLGRLIVPAILRTVPAGGVIYILNGEAGSDFTRGRVRPRVSTAWGNGWCGAPAGGRCCWLGPRPSRFYTCRGGAWARRSSYLIHIGVARRPSMCWRWPG